MNLCQFSAVTPGADAVKHVHLVAGKEEQQKVGDEF